MTRFSALMACGCLSLATPAALHALPSSQVSPGTLQSIRVVRDIKVTGARELSADVVREAAHVAVGDPLPDSFDALGDLVRRVERRYREEGYTFASVKAEFAEETGVLTLSIDEGLISGVEFAGIDAKLARRFAEEFALRAGDVFNRSRARQALEVLLRETRGAIRPGTIHQRGTTFTDSRQLSTRPSTFDLIDRNGQRILLVGLSEPAGRFKLVPDLGDREDWFTSVDGLVPSLGFGAAVFDHENFNHAYVAGHLSYKMAAGRAGYALGFERPMFGATKLYFGGELHDLTASDDQWQVSSLEASLSAVGPRRSFRDYYRRRGIQVSSAFRAHPQVEFLMAWRGERHEPLEVQSSFSLWNSDQAFRPNRLVWSGRLNALVIGASINGHQFDRESLDAAYRRHQLDSLFGDRLEGPDSRDDEAFWRVDWTSEISSPGAFGGDFDFRRHVVTARYRVALSPHQELGARAIGGWSDGTLPLQRMFAIGGIGSVHGYPFKEAVGNSLALVNLEYALGWRDGLKAIGFFDAGRVDWRAPWLKGVGFGFGLGDFRIDFGYKTDAVPSSLQVLLRFGRTF